jgi:predicted Zn-dependent protease
MSQNTSQKPIYRIITILSAIAFGGSTLFGIVGLYISAFQEPKSNVSAATASKDAQLKELAQGYELVLKREPDNQLALQGLVQARIQLNDLQGAIEPMEKLVKLNPERADYKTVLGGIKQRLGKGG